VGVDHNDPPCLVNQMNKIPTYTFLCMPVEPVFTVKECAEKLKVTERTILELIRKKKLRAVKVGREYRITESAINEFLN